MIFGFQNAPKIKEKEIQTRGLTTARFGFDFRMDFLRFGLQKRRQNRASFVSSSKTPILQKSLFSLRGNHYFSGSEPPKLHQNWMLKRIEK